MSQGNSNSQIKDGLEWMDIRAVTEYASVSERTVREWIRLPTNRLPAVQVGGKILIRKSILDRWLESHPFQAESVDISRIVDEVVGTLTEAQ